MSLIIDVETENTGSDIMRDNKRIISVQVGDDVKQELYYADSKDPKYTLVGAKSRIISLLSQGHVFAGYNTKFFDIPVLKQFLGVEIPESNMLDLFQTSRVTELKARGKRVRFEDVCKEFEIECFYGVRGCHKRRMNEKAEKYRDRQDIKELAYAKAKSESMGWSFDYSFGRVLDKIAVGNAIYDAYQEFVKGGGQRNTLFYEYAIGDVICEYRLLKTLRQNG